jgi:pilus assembly protein CpaF
MASAVLEIRRPGGAPAKFPLVPGIYTVGRDEDCKLCLSHPQVDKRHAILTIRSDGFWIDDLGAENGTYIDGEKVQGRQRVRFGQDIVIGPFVMSLVPDDASPAQPTPVQPAPPRPEPAAAPVLPQHASVVHPPAVQAAAPITPAPAATPPAFFPNSAQATPPPGSVPHPIAPPATPPSSPELQLKRSVKQQIHHELLERLDIKRLSASHISRDELRSRAMATIHDIVKEVSGRLPPGIDPAALAKDVCDEALGLGPIEEFLADDEVTEVMVNGPNQIYVERKGKLIRTDNVFMDDASVVAIIERIVSPIGRRIDESQPYVDARLPDGSRVNAIIAPLSLVGPCLTIRKFARTPFTDKDMIRMGTITASMAEFLRICVVMRKNIIVSGGTGSGKTTFLNVLSNYLPANERIVTIEDAAELRLNQAHIIRLESRPPNIEGRGAITIRDLVRNALRMRPDRIVVGECRGGEALDMLQAMNTGHDGSLTTVHANTPRDVVSRLETLVLMAGMDLPTRAIREQISSALDLIVHESRMSDGSRKIVKITEIVGQEGDQITMQDIFEYEQKGLGENGRVLGAFKPTGAVPTFIEEIRSRGLSINRSMFDPLQWKE